MGQEIEWEGIMDLEIGFVNSMAEDGYEFVLQAGKVKIRIPQ